MVNAVYKDLPLVYSCSGCSNVAQLANQVAVALDRNGKAEMSCIAGVGGGVPSLVRVACSGRKIIAIDGCSLSCTKACLHQKNITPDVHINLSEHGIPKKFHEDCEDTSFDRVFTEVVEKAKKLIYPEINNQT